MEIRPEIHLKQTQKLIMTPQLQQAISMLQLSNIELSEQIERELMENPALEVEEKDLEDERDLEKELINKKKLSDPLNKRYDEGFEDEYFFEDKSIVQTDWGTGEDKKREFLEGAITREKTLKEFLHWQLRLLPVTPEELKIGEILISYIDSKGYLSVPLEEVSKAFEIRLDMLDHVLRMIQSLDPPGVGARDLKECLLIQLTSRGSHPLAERIIAGHLEELKKVKVEDIAKKLKAPPARVREALALISKLEPYPGRQFYSDDVRYIIPDVIVVREEGILNVVANTSSLPRLRVNSYFETLMKHRSADKRIRDFAAEKVRQARTFMHSVAQRESTLLRVARTILEEQPEFFEHGPKYLRPMTLKTVAGALGLHESTVSRITSSKHIQTSFGVFPLKYFFSNSIPAQGSRHYSATSIKEMVRDIIEKEGGKKHLSDHKITHILEKRGIKIARRTVAKYRKGLHILPSNLRR